jgi:hypothetical protein
MVWECLFLLTVEYFSQGFPLSGWADDKTLAFQKKFFLCCCGNFEAISYCLLGFANNLFNRHVKSTIVILTVHRF